MEENGLMINQNGIINDVDRELKFKIYNENFSIRRDICDASSNSLREFIQNTIEEVGTLNVKVGSLKVKGFTEEKMFVLNDGFGMNIQTLTKLANLYGSKKNIDEHLSGNNGNGARLMSLNANMLGTCFVSKTEEDGINACFFERDEEFNPTIYLLNQNNDKYNLLKDYSHLLEVGSKEWTIVIALGNSVEQNTFKQPNYSLESNDEAIKLFFENRYYKNPNSKEIETLINFYVEKEKLTFLEDLYKTVNGKEWVFETNEARYTIKYSDNWGLITPKSFFIFQDEMFDVQSQDLITNLVTSSNHFMRSLQATKIKDKLSVIVELLNVKKTQMDNFRTSVYRTDDKNIKRKITLLSFIDDLKTNSSREFVKFLKSKNQDVEDTEISEEVYNELASILEGRESNGITNLGKNKKNNKKEKNELDTTNEEFVNNPLFEELLEKYPLIEYDLNFASMQLGYHKDDLKAILVEHCKTILKHTKKAFKNLDNANETFNFLYNRGEEYLTRSLNNVFRDLKNFTIELENIELMEAYEDVVSYFVAKLKQDIKDGEVSSKQGKEENKIDTTLKALPINVYDDTKWKEEFGHFKNSNINFAMYDNDSITINIDNKFFKEIRQDFEKAYLEKAFAADDVSLEMETIFNNNVTRLMGYIGGLYSAFESLPQKDSLLNIDSDLAIDYILFLSSEQMSCNKFYIKTLLNKELNKIIKNLE